MDVVSDMVASCISDDDNDSLRNVGYHLDIHTRVRPKLLLTDSVKTSKYTKIFIACDTHLTNRS
jgi:hypothetical protein